MYNNLKPKPPLEFNYPHINYSCNYSPYKHSICPVYKAFNIKEPLNDCPAQLGAYLPKQDNEPAIIQCDIESKNNYEEYVEAITKNKCVNCEGPLESPIYYKRLCYLKR